MTSIWDEYISTSRNPEKLAALSDNGQSVNRMLNEIDGLENFYQRREKAAREFVRYNAPRLMPVLDLILKNGKNRKESIFQLMKILRNGTALKKHIEKRSRRFQGSSAVPRQCGSFGRKKKKSK